MKVLSAAGVTGCFEVFSITDVEEDFLCLLLDFSHGRKIDPSI